MGQAYDDICNTKG
jgi:dsRNA-specific ribonuclease